jgi:hypothetical protein
MAVANSPDAIGNVLRLASLKNASGRRRVRGEVPYLENLNAPVDDDMSGTSAGITPPINSPQVEMGAQLTPQSYDVRANEIIPEEESVFTKLGRSLGARAGQSKNLPELDFAEDPFERLNQRNIEPPVQTQQVEEAEGLPPVNPEMQNNSMWPAAPIFKALGNQLKEYIAPAFSSEKRKEVGDQNRVLLQEAQMRSRGINPEEERARVEQEDVARQASLQEDMERAQQNPLQVPVYGATDEFANSPELQSEFRTFTGIDFTDEVRQATADAEKVISDIEKNINAQGEGYDEQAMRLKERILSNSATDMDKYYIGLALLMPLIVGGIFGKEAGLGALGGTGQGLASILGKRGEQVRKDEELLSDINKNKSLLDLKKGELNLERLKIPSQVAKNIPEDEYADLRGMQIQTVKNPETGEVVAEGPEVFPDMVANLQYYNTAKKREKMGEVAGKLEEEKAALQRGNDATRDVINAVKQLENPGLIAKAIAIGMSEGVDAGGVSLGPNSIKKLYKNTLAPTIKDENGRDVNAAVYLDAKIEQIKDAYRRNEQMRAYTTTVANHVASMAENPLYSGLKPEDLITQMLILRDRSQRFFVDRIKSHGFFAEPIEQSFGQQNRKLYAPLNEKVENRRANQLSRE